MGIFFKKLLCLYQLSKNLNTGKQNLVQAHLCGAMAWEVHEVPGIWLGHSGGPLPCASILLSATQIASKEVRFFFLLVGNKEKKKQSSKLKSETFSLCRQQLSKENETHTALHSKFFKECTGKSFTDSQNLPLYVVFEVKKQKRLLSSLLTKTYLSLFSNTCFSDVY